MYGINKTKTNLTMCDGAVEIPPLGYRALNTYQIEHYTVKDALLRGFMELSETEPTTVGVVPTIKLSDPAKIHGTTDLKALMGDTPAVAEVAPVVAEEAPVVEEAATTTRKSRKASASAAE